MRLFLTVLTLLALAVPIRAAEPATNESPKTPTVAIFELDGPLLEAPTQDLPIFGEQPVALKDLIKRLRAAADDANVKAVVLIAEDLQLGPAQAEEIRGAIKHVRDAGKEVYAHSDSMMMKDYLVFAGANKISMTPTAILLISGLHAETPYVRGLLDKIGVSPDVLHIGAYKSAGEIFTRTGPSPEAEKMTNWLLDSINDSALEMMASGRNVEAGKAKQWVDEGLFTAEGAKAAGLIDAVEQRQDFDAGLKKKFGDSLVYDRKYGVPKDKQIDFSNPFAMFQILGEMFGGPKDEGPKKDAVGVVYVDGMIVPGSSRPSLFGSGGGAHSSDIRRALDKAARDDSIKAVVLRVDSPGGSAVASEIILDATKRLRAKKPLVVSMGNVAGSGGYYVSLGGGEIFADRTTLTASIGVVTGKLVTTEMWNKIGITWKVYERGQRAGLLASDEPFSADERAAMEKFMNEVYGVFQKHVTEARGNKLKKPIDELAGGRVFTGQQALELGLIDKIGTFQDALASAAKQAKLGDDYDVRVVPQPKSVFEQIMEQGKGGDEDGNHWVSAPPPPLPLGTQTSLLDLATPHLQHLDPRRVAAIRTALGQLQLLGAENVILAMPEILVLDSD